MHEHLVGFIQFEYHTLEQIARISDYSFQHYYGYSYMLTLNILSSYIITDIEKSPVTVV